MTVYVESNFVLEQSLQQEECDSCARILDLASTGRILLAVPAFSLNPMWPSRPRKRLALSSAMICDITFSNWAGRNPIVRFPQRSKPWRQF